MEDRFRQIYAEHADWFDQLVSREDCVGGLLPAVTAVCKLEGTRVVELGAGTGRVTRLIAPHARHVYAFDASSHMLQKARSYAVPNATWAVADNRALPLRQGWADVSIEGWSISHSTDWYPERWRAEARRAIDEMLRVLKPGGVAVAIETLGTGFVTPTPPSPILAEYYEWLERDRGFTRTWCRTDYRFESVEEAGRLAHFFFGDALADRIRRERLTELPECTGVWWRRK